MTRRAAICALLLLAVALVFGQTTRHGFVNFDDDTYVVKNAAMAHGLGGDAIVWAFTAKYASNWHPLTWLSHLLDVQLYGLEPWGHHLSSVLVHAAVAILLFLLLERMTGRFWPSAFVAALFAIHPLRVESVAWVSERKDVLSGLFFMLTLWAYVGYARRSFSVVRYILVVILFALGLMCKPMLVTLPCVLLLLDFWPLGRMFTVKPRPVVASRTTTNGRGFTANIGYLALEKIPLFALSAASCYITPVAQGKAVAATAILPAGFRITNALVSYVSYLGVFFCPSGLSPFYPHPENALPLWKALGAVGLLLAVSAVVVVYFRRFPYLLVGWFWYLGMMVPVIGLMQVGAHSMADRYTYLPQIGLAVALTWGIAQAVSSWPSRRWICGIASALMLSSLVICAWRQVQFWRDSDTLWNRALACDSQNARALSNLGNLSYLDGRHKDAESFYRKTLAVKPGWAEIYNNLGGALIALGRLDEAAACYRTAIQLKPNYVEPQGNLKLILSQCEALRQALAQRRAALRRHPDNIILLNDIAWRLATCPVDSLRDGPTAVELAQRAVRLTGGREPAVLGTLAAAQAEAGRYAEAARTARRALKLAEQQNKQSLAESLRAKISLYESGVPYREPTTQSGK